MTNLQIQCQSICLASHRPVLCLEAAMKGLLVFITKEGGEKTCKISEDSDQFPNPRLPMAACPRAALDQPAPEEHLHDSEVQETFLDGFTVCPAESNI